MSGNTGDDVSTTGAVELREDIPLKPSSGRTGAARYLTGIRFVVGCFSMLTAAITIALATQIYYGDYELVPHGAVASDSEVCSRVGTDTLKAGGGAVDAAVAAAFCLAVLSPHTTGLDAAGTLMLFDYRKGRGQGPHIVDWSGPANRSSPPSGGTETPRLVVGLAWLHVRYGRLPWRTLVQPAAQLASGFSVSAGLAAATQILGRASPLGVLQSKETLRLPKLSQYLNKLANKTDEELESLSSTGVLEGDSTRTALGGYRLHTPADQPAGVVLTAALTNVFAGIYNDLHTDDQLVFRTASSLQQVLRSGGAGAAASAGRGTATNVAIVDKDDVYVSLVTGLSDVLGSRAVSAGGYILDNGTVRTLTPVMLTENFTCGHRYVLGAGDVSVLAQVVVNLAVTENDLISSVDRPRFHILQDSSIAVEESSTGANFPATTLQYLASVGALRNASRPYASCNVVQQTGNALSSHADLRGGGIAYRF